MIVIEIVRMMFEAKSSEADESALSGIIFPLFKKVVRKNVYKYRIKCLLSMCSCIHAKVFAKRLAWWAEWFGLLDKNQANFRPGRPMLDVLQIIVRMEEDVGCCKRRVNKNNLHEWPVERLLGLSKAYPLVNKPALWMFPEKNGMKGIWLDSLFDLN